MPNPKIEVQKSPLLKSPKWSKTAAKPGESVELSVTAENADGLTVVFDIRDDKGESLGILAAANDTRKAAWIAPMNADTGGGGVKFTFDALLREKPSAANGHLGVVQRLKSENELAIKGTRITGLKADACFVPKHEKLAVSFKVEGVAPEKGRIEIWGERYPTDKPIYAEEFVPALGDNTWSAWYGGKHPKTSEVKGKITENGPLKDKYLSPEFSPYRLRVITGPDTGSVEAPLAGGLGKVSMAETQFEVKFESLQIRIMQGLTEAIGATVADRRFRLEHVLAVEDRQPNGDYAAMGRLPCLTMWQATFWVAADGDRDFDVSTVDASLKFKKAANELGVWLNDTKLTLTTDYTEEGDDGDLVSKIKLKADLSKASDTLLIARVDPTSIAAQNGRLRIPMGRHSLSTEEPDMAGTGIANGYIHGSGVIKYTVDALVYTRPELPIEIVPLLTSKTASKNAAPYYGVFEAEAVGPLKIEPVADDYYNETLYTAGGAQHQAYFRNAHHKVKKGKHNDPKNDGTKPVFHYWQWRELLTADVTADKELDTSVPDATMQYKVGSNELTVWLNRALLVKDVDYTEVGSNATASSKIKLKKGVGKKDDVVWVVRSDTAASGGDQITAWKRYPAGTNCHIHYGGLRGKDSSTAADCLFLKNYSGNPGGTRDPIIGKNDTGDLPFKDDNFIQLKPDPVTDPAAQERVELTTLVAGAKKGLAGVIFSPSYIAGDSYVLRARLEDAPYERNFGEVSQKPQREAKTGALTNWRWCRINKSLRCPDTGGNYTLRATVGSDLEPALNTRAYKGIGRNINLDVMNATLLPSSFNEWTVPIPIPITAATKNTDPIKITTSVPHGLATGEHVKIWGVKGNTNANGADLTITKVDDTNFTINGVTGNKDYVSGGLMEPLEVHKDLDLEEYVTQHDTASAGIGGGAVRIRTPRNVKILGASNAAPIVVSTHTPHRFETGDRVRIAGVTGNTAANGVHLITVTGPKGFSLNGSTGNGAYVAQGTATLQEFPNPANVTGATNVNPIVITAAGHGFATGETLVIAGVGGNTAANGSHAITRLDDNSFRLDGVAGNADYVSGGSATVANIVITAATKANPIQITTAGAHGLHNRERVTIAGVEGNTAANGDHTITRVDAMNFTIDGVKGNADYTQGGTVKTRDFHHRNITDWFVQADAYRVRLPPAIPVGFDGLASEVIEDFSASGDKWSDVMARIVEVNSSTGVGTHAGTIPLSPVGWSGGDYVMKFLLGSIWLRVAQPIVNHFTPKDANPKTMSVIRWPYLHDPSSGLGITWEGQCLGHGQSLIHSRSVSTTLYSHEMGHSMHLVHFLGGNFGWKHHDLNFPQCMMSYSHISQKIAKPVGAVGVDGDALADGGWPAHGMVYEIFYDKLQTLGVPLDKPCARCMLKLQGWKEEVLPAAWTHPDLF